MEIPCVNGVATIVYDELGVPHIFADNTEDVIFTGICRSKDRLWQMEFQTLAAAGRLSEIVGEKALPIDRFNRRIGILRACKNSLIEIEKKSGKQKDSGKFYRRSKCYIHQQKKQIFLLSIN